MRDRQIDAIVIHSFFTHSRLRRYTFLGGIEASAAVKWKERVFVMFRRECGRGDGSSAPSLPDEADILLFEVGWVELMRVDDLSLLCCWCVCMYISCHLLYPTLLYSTFTYLDYLSIYLLSPTYPRHCKIRRLRFVFPVFFFQIE